MGIGRARLRRYAHNVRLRADDPRLDWRGVAELHESPRGDTEFWRLPKRATQSMGSTDLSARASSPSGVRAELRTDAAAITLDVWSDEPRSPLDLLVDGKLAHRLPLVGGSQQLRAELPGGDVDLDILLPHRDPATIGHLEFVGATSLVARPRPAKRWLTYGSSITQGAFADGPADTWPTLVARRRDWDLFNVGLGGQCQLDPVAARYLRDTAADLVSFCLGVNIHGAGTFSERSLRPAIMGFIQTVRDGHPQTPFVVISPIVAPDRENVANLAGLTLGRIRSIVEEVVAELRALGDERIELVDGLSVLGASDATLLVDGLHPGSEGYALMARRLEGTLAAAMAAGTLDG